MPGHNSTDIESKTPAKPPSRRELIAKLGSGACWTSIGLALIGMIRSYSPWATPEPSGKFKVGTSADYPKGSNRKYPNENVIVFRDEEGMFALSTICSHLGCVVSQAEAGFHCACHGSKFSPLGELLQGPAPKGLDWLEVSLAPSGQLIVDRAKAVPFGTKLNIKTT